MCLCHIRHIAQNARKKTVSFLFPVMERIFAGYMNWGNANIKRIDWMQINDLINGLFEFGGAIVSWINVFKLFKDKEIKGVYWPMWIFFSSWGIWNLFYYPSLKQYISFFAGIFLVSGNIVWVFLAFKYNKGELWWVQIMIMLWMFFMNL